MLLCIVSHLYTTFHHVSAGCAIISSLCMVIVISKGSLESSGAAGMLYIVQCFLNTSPDLPPRETNIWTSAQQTRGCGVCVPAAFQGCQACCWGPRGRCSCLSCGHMVNLVGYPQRLIPLLLHALPAPVLGKDSGLQFPLPPSDYPRQTAAHGGLLLPPLSTSVLQLVSRLFFNEKWL